MGLWLGRILLTLFPIAPFMPKFLPWVYPHPLHPSTAPSVSPLLTSCILQPFLPTQCRLPKSPSSPKLPMMLIHTPRQGLTALVCTGMGNGRGRDLQQD